MTGALAGRVAVVTGAGRGVGRGIALALATEGASVVVNDTGGGPDGRGSDKAPADGVVGEIMRGGGLATANYDSVASFDGAGRIIKTALETFGRLDILVNNAGISRRAPIWELTEDGWDAVIAVHLKGTFNCIRHACAPMMAQHYGRIVNIFSTAAFGGGSNHPPYAAAKGGVWGLTNQLSRDIAPYGITVNTVSPGLTDTRLSAHMVQRLKAEAARQGTPVGGGEGYMLGVMQPEDLAPFVAFLCTEEAGAVNGQAFQAYGPYITWYPPPRAAAALYKEGRWSVEELSRHFKVVMRDAMSNPPSGKAQ